MGLWDEEGVNNVMGKDVWDLTAGNHITQNRHSFPIKIPIIMLQDLLCTALERIDIDGTDTVVHGEDFVGAKTGGVADIIG